MFCGWCYTKVKNMAMSKTHTHTRTHIHALSLFLWSLQPSVDCNNSQVLDFVTYWCVAHPQSPGFPPTPTLLPTLAAIIAHCLRLNISTWVVNVVKSFRPLKNTYLNCVVHVVGAHKQVSRKQDSTDRLELNWNKSFGDVLLVDLQYFCNYRCILSSWCLASKSKTAL